MIDSEQLKNLFPRENEIPEEHRPPGPIHQRSYLIDGVLKTWEGPAQTVLSPVCVAARTASWSRSNSAATRWARKPRARKRWRPPSPPTTMAGANGRP